MPNQKTKYIFLHISGKDRPGIMSKIMQTIAQFDSKIIDISQTITGSILSLSILIERSTQKYSHLLILEKILIDAKALKVKIKFDFFNKNPLEKKQKSNRDNEYILTCVSSDLIPTQYLAKVTPLLAKYSINVEQIENSSFGKKTHSLKLFCSFKKKLTNKILHNLKDKLYAIGTQYKIDLVFIKDNIYRTNKRLICFDMDSTLIHEEVIDEMAKVMKTGEKVIAITQEAMNGNLSFDESLIKRVSMIKGITEKKMENLAKKLTLSQGVSDLISTVQKIGIKTAIISGGFEYFAHYLQKKLGIDYVFANSLEMKNKVATGRIKGKIVNAEAKAEYLVKISKEEDISLEQCIAIGDGANDVPMLAKAGMGIAFHAKKKVREKIVNQINHGSMISILYFLGIKN